MSGQSTTVKTPGFTRLELLCTLAIVLLLCGILLPQPLHHPKSPSVRCVNHLKNVWLSYKIFATDHDDRFPMELSIANEGAMELTNDIAAQFRCLSNEMSAPAILACGARKNGAVEATNWTSLSRANIDYFLNLSARSGFTNSVLSGDTGFHVNNHSPSNGVYKIQSADRIVIEEKFHVDQRPAAFVFLDGRVERRELGQTRRPLQPTNDVAYFLFP